MKLINNAIVYKAEVPNDPALIAEHLKERSFVPPGTFQMRSAGFVAPHGDTESLVATFPGGLAFAVRVDDKIVPNSVINAKLSERLKMIEEDTGRKVGKKARASVKSEIIDELLSIAMVKTTAVITCFYNLEHKYLIVPVTNKKLADVCTSLLIQAVGSVKTETIHVADVKHGLTTRLKAWLQGADDESPDDGFGTFQPCDQVTLKAEKRSVSLRMSGLQNASKAINEALAQGFTVSSLGLDFEKVSFRLDADFHLKGVAHHNDPTEIEDDAWWPAVANIQVANVCDVMNELVRLLSYKPPQDGEPAEETAEAAA